MTTEKIIVVDRTPEKLSEEEMKKIKEDYMNYCIETYKLVEDAKIPNSDARKIMFQHMLSPFQYYIEDKVRIKRENAVVEQPVQRPQAAPVQGPTAPLTSTKQEVQSYKPKWKRY